MIYAIIMSGGMGTRLKLPIEKPLFKLQKKPLIKYVIDNVSSSKFIDKIFIATSPNTPKTKEYIDSINIDCIILDTPGESYMDDLGFILNNFEKFSPDDILVFINADLPFISSKTIDYVIEEYLKTDIDSVSVLVPVEIFEDLELKYSYNFNGLVPSGFNILKSKNVVQEELQLVLPKKELAININTLQDANVANKFYNLYFNDS